LLSLFDAWTSFFQGERAWAEKNCAAPFSAIHSIFSRVSQFLFFVTSRLPIRLALLLPPLPALFSSLLLGCCSCIETGIAIEGSSTPEKDPYPLS
jgi:hypothetical protein